jgi:hypothetical protein
MSADFRPRLRVGRLSGGERILIDFQVRNPKSEISHPRRADNNDQGLSALKEER